MSTESQILALLTGRKVFDGRQWRVYDSGGTELADPGGVLWRGVHGALLWNAALVQTDDQPGQVYGGRRRRVDDLDAEDVRRHWELLELRQASEEQATKAIREASRRAQDLAAAGPVAAAAAVVPPAVAIASAQVPDPAAAGLDAQLLARRLQDEEALVMLLLNF